MGFPVLVISAGPSILAVITPSLKSSGPETTCFWSVVSMLFAITAPDLGNLLPYSRSFLGRSFTIYGFIIKPYSNPTATTNIKNFFSIKALFAIKLYGI